MATAELDSEVLETTLADGEVTTWRFEQLTEAGYPDVAAADLARNRDVDLHVAIGLVRAGCSTDLALRILR
jgi:hypothetical protein